MLLLCISLNSDIVSEKLSTLYICEYSNSITSAGCNKTSHFVKYYALFKFLLSLDIYVYVRFTHVIINLCYRLHTLFLFIVLFSTLHVSTSAGHHQVFHIYHTTTVLRARFTSACFKSPPCIISPVAQVCVDDNIS
jgi:hypothetical protein